MSALSSEANEFHKRLSSGRITGPDPRGGPSYGTTHSGLTSDAFRLAVGRTRLAPPSLLLQLVDLFRSFRFGPTFI